MSGKKVNDEGLVILTYTGKKFSNDGQDVYLPENLISVQEFGKPPITGIKKKKRRVEERTDIPLLEIQKIPDKPVQEVGVIPEEVPSTYLLVYRRNEAQKLKSIKNELLLVDFDKVFDSPVRTGDFEELNNVAQKSVGHEIWFAAASDDGIYVKIPKHITKSPTRHNAKTQYSEGVLNLKTMKYSEGQCGNTLHNIKGKIWHLNEGIDGNFLDCVNSDESQLNIYGKTVLDVSSNGRKTYVHWSTEDGLFAVSEFNFHKRKLKKTLLTGECKDPTLLSTSQVIDGWIITSGSNISVDAYNNGQKKTLFEVEQDGHFIPRTMVKETKDGYDAVHSVFCEKRGCPQYFIVQKLSRDFEVENEKRIDYTHGYVMPLLLGGRELQEDLSV